MYTNLCILSLLSYKGMKKELKMEKLKSCLNLNVKIPTFVVRRTTIVLQ